MSSARLIQIILALSFAAALSGCDACGDWPWDHKSKTCHGEPMQ